MIALPPINKLLCGLLILALLTQLLSGEELKTGRFEWKTLHGVVSTVKNKRIELQDSTGRTHCAEIGLGLNRINAKKFQLI